MHLLHHVGMGRWLPASTAQHQTPRALTCACKQWHPTSVTVDDAPLNDPGSRWWDDDSVRSDFICTHTLVVLEFALQFPHCFCFREASWASKRPSWPRKRGGRQACTEAGRRHAQSSWHTAAAKSVPVTCLLKTACVVASLHHSEKTVSRHQPLEASAAMYRRVQEACIKSSRTAWPKKTQNFRAVCDCSQ